MRPPRQLLTPYRILGLAAVAGVVGGLGLSYRAGLQHQAEVDEIMAEAGKQLPPQGFPAPPPLPRTKGPTFNMKAVEGLPPYPGGMPADLLSQPEGVGGEMQMVWFETPDSPSQIIYYYEQKFAEKGLFSMTHFYSEAAGYVGYLDPKAEIDSPGGQKLHLISVIRQGERSVVFASSSYPQKLLNGDQKLPAGVPELPGTSSSLVFNFDERSLAQKSWVGTIENKTIDEVMTWYQQSFKEKGWQVGVAQIGDDGTGKIEASRAPSHATVSIRRKNNGLSVYLTLSG